MLQNVNHTVEDSGSAWHEIEAGYTAVHDRIDQVLDDF